MEKFGVEYVADLAAMDKVDSVVLATLHRQFKEMQIVDFTQHFNGADRGVLVDVKSWFLGATKDAAQLIYKCL